MVSENSIQIGLLGTDTQNFGEVRSSLYSINLFEKYEQYQKKFFSKTALFLYLMFEYQILWKSICWVKSWKYTIYFPPFWWRQRT